MQSLCEFSQSQDIKCILIFGVYRQDQARIRRLTKAVALDESRQRAKGGKLKWRFHGEVSSICPEIFCHVLTRSTGNTVSNRVGSCDAYDSFQSCADDS